MGTNPASDRFFEKEAARKLEEIGPSVAVRGLLSKYGSYGQGVSAAYNPRQP